MENLWDVVSGKETQPTLVQEVNATSTSPSTNQTEILTWKNKDHVALAAIWDFVENLIFSHVGACKIANEAWLALENTYSASNIVTQSHLQEKFITQKMKIGEWEERAIKSSSSDSHALFVGRKGKTKWQPHKSNPKDYKLLKLCNEPTTPCLHCKKMGYWDLECFKYKTRVAANLAITNHDNKKNNQTWKQEQVEELSPAFYAHIYITQAFCLTKSPKLGTTKDTQWLIDAGVKEKNSMKK
uniref:Retrotransposon Copia-like N-terminal domain-containing protein n=1 Tax=Physcomitrium patens TaxID=3218 RepID=A0A2K1KKH8_PHYPA|nr:hypothetical protein PHYPA_007971 [Physcomitrium patens]